MEIVPQVVTIRNNAKIDDITNAEFYVGKAEEVLPEYYHREYQESHGGETAHADVMRCGCHARLRGIIATDHCRHAARRLYMLAATAPTGKRC